MKLGADAYVNTSNQAELKASAGKFSFLLDTVANQHDIGQYIALTTEPRARDLRLSLRHKHVLPRVPRQSSPCSHARCSGTVTWSGGQQTSRRLRRRAAQHCGPLPRRRIVELFG
jgi:hypothetical protein